ncbi:MAG: hypothetical protein QOF41_1109 [Methylobacteriaceae bacterium]|nr:hypothetical protein [Methylobacteriaceae bacterium]
MLIKSWMLGGVLGAALPCLTAANAAELPDAVAAKGETIVLQVHAEGAQIYECKADAGGKLAWQFREPIASLISEGKTIGRHYAGPNWEIEDSGVAAKAAGRAQGATSKDIPWLKLDVTDHRGSGPLKDVTTVQRINTKGGAAEGACQKAGELHSEPYSADYVFLRKGS